MKNLHSIKLTKIPQSMLTDMFLANLWAFQADLNGPENSYTIMISNRLEYNQNDYAGGYSPIIYSYISQGRKYYEPWYWEDWRLEEWENAGTPMPDLNLPYGDFDVQRLNDAESS